MNDLLLTFYGDDLTGSTDSLEALALGGVPTVLFLEPPTFTQLARFPEVRAVGFAGMSRTMNPAEMDKALPSVFTSLRALGAPLTHYKVCSTFDSSPEIGSIGRATDIGMHVFASKVVPVAVGAPKLKRYVVFGNHFVTDGDITFRLDRHPTMSKHPVTPISEGDLRLYLGQQTQHSIGLIDVRHLTEPENELDTRLQCMINDGIEIIILDTLDKNHLYQVGRLLWSLGHDQPSFVVGSSGVEFALTDYWQSTGIIERPQPMISPGPVDQIVAISGSAAPMTAVQIEWALDHGFRGIQLNGTRLVDPRTAPDEIKNVVDQAIHLINGGYSVILYSALGPHDLNITKTRARMDGLGLPLNLIGKHLGFQQGLILKQIIERTGLRRVAVAGGDTCGYVLRQLSIYILELAMPLGIATPLCRGTAHENIFDGLEIAMKGGQLGQISFFENVRQGSSA